MSMMSIPLSTMSTRTSGPPPLELPATILKFSEPSGSARKVERTKVNDLLRFFNRTDDSGVRLEKLTSPCFIFVETRQDERIINDKNHPLLNKIEDIYGVPKHLWARTYWESNGYFGCDEGDSAYNTWFFFLVKQIVPRNKDQQTLALHYNYTWYKMAFFTNWTSGKTNPGSILCLNCPEHMIGAVHEYLDDHLEKVKKVPRTDPRHYYFYDDPYCFHPAIVYGVSKCYDSSVWALNEITRHFETARSLSRSFDVFNEAGRHIIHSTETLTNGQEVVATLINEHASYMKSMMEGSYIHKSTISNFKYIERSLKFYRTVLFGIKCRSESLQARQASVYSSLLNLTTIREAKLMRAVGTLTILFLPMTTVATIFGTNFFNYDPNPDSSSGDAGSNPAGNEWSVSPEFRRFWAAAIPSTLIVPLVFFKSICQYFRDWYSERDRKIFFHKVKIEPPINLNKQSTLPIQSV